MVDKTWEKHLKLAYDKHAAIVSSSHLCSVNRYDDLGKLIPNRPLFDTCRHWQCCRVSVDNYSRPSNSASQMYADLEGSDLPENFYTLVILMIGSNMEQTLNSNLSGAELDQFLKDQASLTADYVFRCFLLLVPTLLDRTRGRIYVILPPGRTTPHFNKYLQKLDSMLKDSLPKNVYYGRLDNFHDRFLNIKPELLNKKGKKLDVHLNVQAYARFNTILNRLAKKSKLI